MRNCKRCHGVGKHSYANEFFCLPMAAVIGLDKQKFLSYIVKEVEKQ